MSQVPHVTDLPIMTILQLRGSGGRAKHLVGFMTHGSSRRGGGGGGDDDDDDDDDFAALSASINVFASVNM